MLRTHTCGELRLTHQGKEATLAGWVQRVRNMGGMTFIDLRDRYGVTQLVFNMERNAALCGEARKLGREFVIRITGTVTERSSRNPNLPTGDIEIMASEMQVLNASKTPPFTIEEETDGGEELRMKYRYLDLRRKPLQENLFLRHRLTIETRNYLNGEGFIEIETPVLIKSTPEGARDFVVPSRVNQGQFYALPQSPQTFKQLLMVSGFDKYYQIVRCFRDEDLRADRQPEFTQIDCEMSFIEREDVLRTFEGLVSHLFKAIKGIDLGNLPVLQYTEAMRDYGTDKPDLRFGMKLSDIGKVAKGKGFKAFDEAETVTAICASGCAGYSRKQLDDLTEWVKRPQIGAKGLVWVKLEDEPKSSVDKFYSKDELMKWAETTGAVKGDLLLVLAGASTSTLHAAGELRLEMGSRLGLRKEGEFRPLWVVDFPLVGWDEETKRWHAIHHPFTSPMPEDIALLDKEPAKVKANAYDMVINGVEVGGGSVRIHNRALQQKMFDLLGFTREEAEKQFGFLMGAFEYGAPPHGGIAFGFDRLCALFGGAEVIRDFIAFPKNNAGRDVMLDAPSTIHEEQMKELGLARRST